MEWRATTKQNTQHNLTIMAHHCNPPQICVRESWLISFLTIIQFQLILFNCKGIPSDILCIFDTFCTLKAQRTQIAKCDYNEAYKHAHSLTHPAKRDSHATWIFSRYSFLNPYTVWQCGGRTQVMCTHFFWHVVFIL